MCLKDIKDVMMFSECIENLMQQFNTIYLYLYNITYYNIILQDTTKLSLHTFTIIDNFEYCN